jgi:hypothetical protein
MLEIRINSDVFDLPEDIQVPIVASNPLVSETGFNEIFTYSFSLKASPRNKTIFLKYVNKNARITLSFQSHKITEGVARMKMDSGGISIIIKNDALDLRQNLENTTFSVLDLPKISICDQEDTPIVKIEKWNDYMNSKLPANEPWNEGSFKFTPIYAAPAIEWALNEDQSQREINPTMWDNGFPINAYSLLDGNYIPNYGIELPQKASFKLLVPGASVLTGGQYFIFNSAENQNKYYCWYKIHGIGTDPAPSGRTSILVNLDSSDDSPTVATKTATQIAFLLQFFEVTDLGTGIIIVENKIGGLTDSPSNINVSAASVYDIENGSGTIEQANNNWRTTVSPTLRIAYLIKEVAKYFKLSEKNSYLEAIPEYQALIHYAGKVLDLREDDNDYQYNVHGLEIDLNEFKPNTFLIQIFIALRHLFGVSFNYSNSKLLIEPINFNSKYYDISKFCMPEFLVNELDNIAFRFTYGLGENSWKYGDFYLKDSVGKYLNYYEDVIVGEGIIQEQKVPFNVLVDSNQVPTSFKWPELAKSKAYNENDFLAAEQFQLGLFRGDFEVDYEINTNPFIDPIIATNQRLICFNQNKLLPNDSPIFGETLNYGSEFGTCSIYLKNLDSYLNVYAKFLNKIKLYNQEIEKNLNLPFQNILEIMKWKQPIHTIQQRNMSFVGIVKDLKFTLSKFNVSPVTITYLSNKKFASGDYNSDFNVDFNS